MVYKSIPGDVVLYFDLSRDDYHLKAAATGVRGEGTDLSAYFTTDVDGETRVAWDIGADEYNPGYRPKSILTAFTVVEPLSVTGTAVLPINTTFTIVAPITVTFTVYQSE